MLGSEPGCQFAMKGFRGLDIRSNFYGSQVIRNGRNLFQVSTTPGAGSQVNLKRPFFVGVQGIRDERDDKLAFAVTIHKVDTLISFGNELDFSAFMARSFSSAEKSRDLTVPKEQPNAAAIPSSESST